MLNFSVDELKLEDVYFKRVTPLSISINVIKEIMFELLPWWFLKTFTLTASVKNICESIEKHLGSKGRGYVETK